MKNYQAIVLTKYPVRCQGKLKGWIFELPYSSRKALFRKMKKSFKPAFYIISIHRINTIKENFIIL